MKLFIPDTDKTITLPVGIDFREPGQPSPYRDRSEDEARQFASRRITELLGAASPNFGAAAQGVGLNLLGMRWQP